MRRLSIGSPLLSSIRTAGYRSSPAGSSSITTHPAWPDLNAIAPLACKGALAQVSVLGAMVSVFPYPGMLGVSHARTTFLTSTLQQPWHELIEYSRVVDSRVSMLAQRAVQVQRGAERWFPVWISPLISQLAPSRRLARWYAGLAHVRSHVHVAG